MANKAKIAEFDTRDGLTPWQARKLNYNFRQLSENSPGGPGGGDTVEVDEVVTLLPGADAYVEDVGYPPISKLRFGIPQGEKGDKGDQGEKGEKGDKGDKGDPGSGGAVASLTNLEIDAICT